MRSGNPTLNAFEKPMTWDELGDAPAGASSESVARAKSGTMTVAGTATALGVMLGLCAAAAVGSWTFFEPWLAAGTPGKIMPWLLGGGLGAFVIALVVTFKPKTAPVLGPVYAILEGVFLSAASLFVVARFLPAPEDGTAIGSEGTGLIFQAVLGTFGIAGGLLAGYASGLIRVGSTMKKVMVVMLGGVMIYAVGLFLLNGLFGMGIPNLWASASPLGIGFSALLVVLASLMLVWDFEVVDQGVKNAAPKYMEWYGGFAILVTLAWMYLELLRLLAKLRSND
ncbi:MAG: Bax inhibitor-1/YccA family protein [Planctomycetota bacterium]